MNNSSQLVWSWDGEPFGATPANGSVGPVTTFTYNLRFPGQYYDQETGYHQNRWREYDPKQGKYLQSDPLGLAAGVNTYAYVGSSPLMFIDPLGLWSTEAHNYFIDQVFSNLPDPIRDIIKEGSAYSDKYKYQGPDYAFMHAMSSSKMNSSESQIKLCEYVKNTLDDANYALSKGEGNYWFMLGMALHPVMDSTSPAHEGFKKWNGILKDGNKHGGMPGSLEDIATAKLPYHSQRTIARMQKALKGDLSLCGCK